MYRALILAFMFSLAACKKAPNQTKLTYMPDMADSPKMKAQLNFLDPPEGSITMTDPLLPETLEEAEKELQNPLKGRGNEEAMRARGKELFETFCSVCHGMDAKGGGTIVDKFPRPPDLTADIYKNRADGFYFHRITNGSALMPAYGYALYPQERWQIVLHLKTLQTAGAEAK